ncbi:steroid delta-isomerase [Halothece sp. PCC 7418]|uniref:nuclear transport factor 2 family protein n=1 Tax=Halothece sp. (strain PCC 7418) TaxID=65093 RepID=UPI0002A084E3|nr:nuclear transport factor 2 family protein [Halothece sp. PCC 7418]AFZ45310.1 steroid delta-isomerase [Halothece sp. PCC 7418]
MSIASPSRQPITISGLKHGLVEQYFQTLNAQDFNNTAGLFARDGELHPPLEEPVVGNSAIAQYLAQEAMGMTLVPQKGTIAREDQGELDIRIQGYVKTSLFTVNVAWQFLINADNQFQIVVVKLLASWEELAQIQR